MILSQLNKCITPDKAAHAESCHISPTVLLNQCSSLQNSGSHLPYWPLCLPVLSYQPPGSGQCAFATLSTSIYPVFPRLSGGYSVSLIYTNVTKSSGQTKTISSLWKKYFVTFERELWVFHPLPSTPMQKSWATGCEPVIWKKNQGFQTVIYLLS